MVMIYGAERAASARRALVQQLKRAGATSQDKAVPLEVHGRTEERVLKLLLRKEVIRRGVKGGYWLDPERHADCQRRQLIFVIGAILVTVGIMVCAMLYTQ